ncbi:hypothetical protein [Salininema proteolyticum]|uniref:Uncharacterized protein n=1 Tax=Salininema proteolyticum TaxID=1607685 RepID=A0ABV8U014_9ACTN
MNPSPRKTDDRWWTPNRVSAAWRGAAVGIVNCAVPMLIFFWVDSEPKRSSPEGPAYCGRFFQPDCPGDDSSGDALYALFFLGIPLSFLFTGAIAAALLRLPYPGVFMLLVIVYVPATLSLAQSVSSRVEPWLWLTAFVWPVLTSATAILLRDIRDRRSDRRPRTQAP